MNEHGGTSRAEPRADTPRYEATIRWTTHGVPHIRAEDWGGLGFGQGYACARDRLATICDHVLKVRSERSRFLGRGPGDRHLHSDLGYLALDVAGRAASMAASQPPEVTALVEGYAAGVNAWLAEHGTSAVPRWCADAPWIRPISPADLYAMYVDLGLMGSGRNLIDYVGSASPPGAVGHEPAPPPPPGNELIGEPELGSNGWAFGQAATDNGRGMVMANPHFPWYGEGKLWECHLTLPGELDVYGASLVGSPGVQIGFNDQVAWTHTFSRGHRFTVYRLELDPSDPTRYRYGDTTRTMTSQECSVDVLGEDGKVHEHTATLWSSHYGPMLNLPFIGWGDELGFTYRDANLDNDRFLRQVLALDRSTGIDDLRAAFAREGGLPWVNTMAADSLGRCWYIDSSATPALSVQSQERFVRAVDEDPITALLHGMRVALLDGSSGDDEWLALDGAPTAGLVPTDALPQDERDDHVFNANDPYWLHNATDQIPAHSPMHGLHHRPVSSRTRMNARLVSGEGPVQPSGANERWTREDLVALVLGNHSLLALELRTSVADRCRTAGEQGTDGADLAQVAAILDDWDGTYDLDAVGAVLWRELLAGFDDAALTDVGALWEQAWDPHDPVRTPSGLAPLSAEGPDPVVLAARSALSALEQAGLGPKATLRECQWALRGDQRHPIHGGGEIEGVANVVTPTGALARADLEPGPPLPTPVPGRERTGLAEDGYQVTYGVSFVMVASFDEDGPHAEGLLVYGQSDAADSAHHSDQLEAFERKELRPLRFTDADIAADPALVTEVITG